MASGDDATFEEDELEEREGAEEWKPEAAAAAAAESALRRRARVRAPETSMTAKKNL